MASVSFNASTGIQVPSTREVRDDLATKIQSVLQASGVGVVDVDSTSALGQIIDIVAAEIEAKNSEIAFLASQFSPRQASGLWLEALGSLYSVERKASEPTVVTCKCTGLKGTVIPFGAVVQDADGTQLTHTRVDGAVIGEDGTVLTDFATIEHGAIQIAAGAVSRIVTVVAGWDSVTNEAAGVVGRSIEADGEFYQRMLDSYAMNGNSTVANIQAQLGELDGVLDVIVLENPTGNPVVKNGINVPAHSIATCIVGGDDEAIAKTLYTQKSAGCGTTGNAEVTFVDKEHSSAVYTYKIVRPTATDFRVKVAFFGESLDETTLAKVKAAITSDFLGEGYSGRVKLATTVYASRFYRPIQDVTDAPIKEILIGLGDGSMGTSVEVPGDKSPAIDDEGIEVVFEAEG